MIRVVIADDLNVDRAQAQRVARDAGCEIVGLAKNGQEAVDLCRRLSPDVVLLDIAMPVLTGLQAARIIAEEQIASTIVVVSTQAQHAIMNQLKDLGARFCLKPYDQGQLHSMLKRLAGAAHGKP